MSIQTNWQPRSVPSRTHIRWSLPLPFVRTPDALILVYMGSAPRSIRSVERAALLWRELNQVEGHRTGRRGCHCHIARPSRRHRGAHQGRRAGFSSRPIPDLRRRVEFWTSPSVLAGALRARRDASARAAPTARRGGCPRELLRRNRDRDRCSPHTRARAHARACGDRSRRFGRPRLRGRCFLHPLQAEHPAWGRGMDFDAEVAVATRRSLLARAAARGHLIAAPHWDVVVELSSGPDGGTCWTSVPAQ